MSPWINAVTDEEFAEMQREGPQDGKALALLPDVAAGLQGNVEQLGAYLTQMGQIMLQLQRRLDELEMKQKMQTLSHDEVLQLMLKIRLRAAEYCTRYELNDKKEEAAVRAAIKKAVLKQQGIRDLHDCPQIALEGVVKLIDRWTDIRLVMKMREKARTDVP